MTNNMDEKETTAQVMPESMAVGFEHPVERTVLGSRIALSLIERIPALVCPYGNTLSDGTQDY